MSIETRLRAVKYAFNYATKGFWRILRRKNIRLWKDCVYRARFAFDEIENIYFQHSEQQHPSFTRICEQHPHNIHVFGGLDHTLDLYQKQTTHAERNKKKTKQLVKIPMIQTSVIIIWWQVAYTKNCVECVSSKRRRIGSQTTTERCVFIFCDAIQFGS